jgi:hypothetical protein
MHEFQISLIKRIIDEFDKPFIIDVGDSAGTHFQYLKKMGKKFDSLSINIDPQAVDRIKKKGLPTKLLDVEEYNLKSDIVFAFQTLEHLPNPIRFLKNVDAKYIVMTVPYLRQSKVGCIRSNSENTHIFELCPKDWKIIMKHGGWSPVYEEIYYQYSWGILRRLWRWFDYEGFYGGIFERRD